METNLTNVLEAKEEQYFRMKLCVKYMERLGDDASDRNKEL